MRHDGPQSGLAGVAGAARTEAAFVYTPALAEGKLRSSHPLKLARVRACHDLLAALATFSPGVARVVPPVPATIDDALRVHTPAYLDLVRQLSERPERADGDLAGEAQRHGLMPEGDTPPYDGMLEYQLLVAGATLETVRLVEQREAPVAFNAAGGVNHHAMPDRGSGFGVLNDTAIAIAALRSRGRRVLYLDLDVHHGDGVEAAFLADPDVLTISLHESTRFLFPGPKGGLPHHTGEGAGAGSSANVALPPYCDDETWLWAFDQVVPPLYRAFQPDVLLVQLGADGYFADPLAHLLLTERAYVEAVQRVMALTGGRFAAVGGGGYDVHAAPRIWAAEFLTMAGQAVPPDLVTSPETPPVLDAPSAQHVRHAAEETVSTVQRLVFPVWGASPPPARAPNTLPSVTPRPARPMSGTARPAWASRVSALWPVDHTKRPQQPGDHHHHDKTRNDEIAARGIALFRLHTRLECGLLPRGRRQSWWLRRMRSGLGRADCTRPSGWGRWLRRSCCGRLTCHSGLHAHRACGLRMPDAGGSPYVVQERLAVQAINPEVSQRAPDAPGFHTHDRVPQRDARTRHRHLNPKRFTELHPGAQAIRHVF